MFWEDGSQLDRRGLRAGVRAWEARQMRATCGAVLPQAWSLGKATGPLTVRLSWGAAALGSEGYATGEVMSGI